MSFKLKGLREKRAAVKEKIRALGKPITTENRAMTADEQTAFAALKTEWVSLGEEVKKTEDAMKALDDLVSADSGDDSTDDGSDAAADGAGAADMTQNSGVGRGKNKPQKRNTDGGSEVGPDAMRQYRRLAFQAWARKQHGRALTRAQQEACKRTGVNPRSRNFDVISKRVATLTNNVGGYTVAREFSDALDQALKDFSNVRGVVDEFDTDTGAALDYPTEDDTGNTGELLTETTGYAVADDSFGVVVFNSYKMSSKGMLISNELLEDSAFDLDSLIGTQAGTRLGRIEGSYFTTGTGTSQPKGIVVCSTLGVTTAAAAAFTAAELTRLAFSVDPAYRRGPKVGYMMNDSTIAYALLLTDSTGRPLLRESFRDGMAELQINGYPIWTNQFMTGTTSGVPVTATKHVLFGDMSKFKIRNVGPTRLRRLDERYAELDQVGFIAFKRVDSNCVNTAAIKHMLQA